MPLKASCVPSGLKASPPHDSEQARSWSGADSRTKPAPVSVSTRRMTPSPVSKATSLLSGEKARS